MFGGAQLACLLWFSVEALFSPPKVVAFGRTIYRNDRLTIWGRPRVATESTILDKYQGVGADEVRDQRGRGSQWILPRCSVVVIETRHAVDMSRSLAAALH